MQKIQLPGTPIVVSRFVFGTASLFNGGNAAARSKLLFSAVNAGFTHFDTAPYYGFGTAERDLAPVLKRHPELTVTTKVGIYSPGGELQSTAVVFMRKAAGRFIRSFSRPTVDFSVSRAQTALEGSLRRLNRDRIDIYTLHEPEHDLVRTDEWQRWLERMVTDGKICSFGLALTADKLEPFLVDNSRLSHLVQVQDSLGAQEANILLRFGRPLQITYGYVSSARKEGSTLAVAEVLRRALDRNAQGAIIVSTTRAARLSQYARLAEAVSHD